ncbi:hypothetical protein LCGC14_0865170 [marine sediment metagenome]|uniref:Uncharacterized protein n=1 Tax=marine sediment metagenome TaxID=412755 RepID=A0A0F9PBA3_9ZZZZ
MITTQQVWYTMKQRCTNPNAINYHNYGGRGIKVLYKDFGEFLADVGPKPGPEYSIDRIDNDGHYEPGNCKWSTRSEQMKNRRWQPPKGENHPKAKLTDNNVREILQLFYEKGYSQIALRKMYNVSLTAICNIINRKSWKHIKHKGGNLLWL